MKILHVTAQKPDSTGSGVYLNQMVTSLARLGHVQAVVCGIAPDDVPALPQGVAVHPVMFETPQLPFPVCGMSDEMPYKSTRYRDMTPLMVDQYKAAFTRAVTDAIAQLQPDVIVCNHLYILTSLVRRLAPAAKVYGICHSTCLRQLRSHDLERAFIIEGIRSLDGILALHEQQKSLIMELFGVPARQVGIIGTGYDATVLNRGKDEPRTCDLVYVGKISYKKGVESFVRSLDLLPTECGRLAVHLVGGAGNANELERIAQLAQQSRHDVQLLGRVSQGQLVEEYRHAKTFVLPSFYEGLPLVTIEAMACGCNVVVTDIPGVRPWLSSNIQDASVSYVTLPRIQGVDTPVEEDLPDFERRLAAAICENLQRSPFTGDVSHLSWDGLAKRLLGLVS